jgi:2'-5' RNA ligase
MNEKLYFLALLPPPDIQDEVTRYKQYAAEYFNASHALKSPPHITLIPPFWWEENRISEIIEWVENWTTQTASFTIALNDFDCFKPRVIYIDVVPNVELTQLQNHLKIGLKTKFQLSPDKRPDYHPHMTVAYKDLSKRMFYAAWDYYQKQSFKHHFQVNGVSLLKHNQKRWKIDTELSFGR